jgi:hypothetical protein
MRRIVMAAVLFVAALPVGYDLAGYRLAPKSTWCRKTALSSPKVWPSSDPVGAELNISGSTDFLCGPCDIRFRRQRRFLLPAVNSGEITVPECK